MFIWYLYGNCVDFLVGWYNSDVWQFIVLKVRYAFGAVYGGTLISTVAPAIDIVYGTREG